MYACTVTLKDYRKTNEYIYNKINNLIRLPPNLRPTTRECVHLVTRGHFRTLDKMVVTPLRPFHPPYPKTPCYTQTLWPNVLYNRSYCPWKFHIAGDFFYLLPFLLDLWPWPWPDDLHIRTWHVFHGDIPRVQLCSLLRMLWFLKIIVWLTDR